MSEGQEGGSGDSRRRKRISGGAKHAYGDMHPKFNRIERRRRNSGIYDGEDGRMTGSKKGARTKMHFEQKMASLKAELKAAKDERAVYEVKTGSHDDWANWLIKHLEENIEKTLKKMRDIENRGGA